MEVTLSLTTETTPISATGGIGPPQSIDRPSELGVKPKLTPGNDIPPPGISLNGCRGFVPVKIKSKVPSPLSTSEYVNSD